jgi:hypothetical protein
VTGLTVGRENSGWEEKSEDKGTGRSTCAECREAGRHGVLWSRPESALHSTLKITGSIETMRECDWVRFVS